MVGAFDIVRRFMAVLQDDLPLLLRKIRSGDGHLIAVNPVGRQISMLWKTDNPPESIQIDHAGD